MVTQSLFFRASTTLSALTSSAETRGQQPQLSIKKDLSNPSGSRSGQVEICSRMMLFLFVCC